MIDKAAGGDKRVADTMKAIFEGESDHTKGVFDVGDHGASFGPFQMDVEGGRLGAQFQAATGKDPSSPDDQQAVTDWVAGYLKKQFAANPNYDPGKTWFGYPHGLERIRRGQVHPNDTVMNVPLRGLPSPIRLQVCTYRRPISIKRLILSGRLNRLRHGNPR